MIFQRLVVYFSLVVLFSLQSHSQTSPEVRLLEVLKDLEERFDITFSYADDLVKDRVVPADSSFTSIKDWQDFLAENTGLVFQRISGSIITISKNETFEPYEISGTITDAETTETIPFATISTRYSYTISNESGQYELPINRNGIDSIYVSHLAYMPSSFAIPGVASQKFNLNLIPRFKTLPEIVVSNYLVGGISRGVSGEYVFKPKNQQILPGLSEPDILFTIQAFPGIQSVGESVSDINIRGGTNDQNLVLWDGMRLYQSGHFFGLISAFNPHVTSQVTLVKNGTSAEFGNGVSGTILMKSAFDQPEKVTGEAGSNLLHSDVNVKVPIGKKAAFSIAGRRSLTDFFDTPTFNNYFDRAFQNSQISTSQSSDTILQSTNDFYFYDLNATLRFKPSPKNEVRISAIHIFNQLSYTESKLSNDILQEKISELGQNSTAGGVFFDRLWSKKVKTSFSSSLSTYNLNAFNQDITNEQSFNQKNNVIDITLSGKANIALSPRHNLNTGYTYNESAVGVSLVIDNPAFRNEIQEVLTSHILFLESDASLPDEKTDLKAGVRLNYYPKLNDKFIPEPRVSVRHQLDDRFALEFTGEMKNQTKTQIIDLQTDFLGVEKRRWALSNNRDIPVLRSGQVSLGISYEKAHLITQIEGYFKKVNNIITSSQGFQNQFEGIRSAGNYETYGVETLIQYTGGSYSIWTSYVLAKNQYRFNSLTPSQFPNNLDITHNLFLGGSYQTGSLELSTGIYWRSGRPITRPLTEQPINAGRINFSSPNSDHLQNYLRIDLSSVYHLKLSDQTKAEVGFSIWNLTNHSNIINEFYQLGSENETIKLVREALKFTPNFMVRVSF